MPRQPKPRPVGRPKLPKGHAKLGALQVRLHPEMRQRLEAAAKADNLTVSEWIRGTLEAKLEERQ
jgi:predicted DNA-binding protein